MKNWIRNLTALLLVLVSSSAYAQGNLTTKYSLLNRDKNSYFGSNPEFGLWVNEHVVEKFEFQSWTGYSLNRWFVGDIAIMRPIVNRVKLGIGPTYSTNFRDQTRAVDVKVTLEVKLWD